MISDTQELLAKFVNDGSESAFRELVTRYFDLVYSTAVRLVDGDAHRAEDVAQVVFCDFARMANKLSGNTMFGGWLHRHTCFVARTAMRGERRRQAREKQAVEMNALDQEGESVAIQVAPILDEAINELEPDDRGAILLRFFEHRNLRSVGEAMGMSESAAQKRVARALEELRTLLHQRGVTLSGAALASGLAVGAVKAAPAGLALSAAGAVLAGVSTGRLGLTSAKVGAMAKLKVSVIAAFIVVTAGITLVLLQRQPGVKASSGRRAPNQKLSQRQEGNAVIAESVGRETAAYGSAYEVLTPPSQGAVPRNGEYEALTRTMEPSVALSQPILPAGAIGATVRLYSKVGSKVRIEGTSSIHDWQVEGYVSGMLEAGPGIPLEPGTAMHPGPVRVTMEAFVAVHTLKSLEKDGTPYSDNMNELMYESLQASLFPKIGYRLLEMSFKGTTNYNETVQYVYQSRGELSIAGATNEISMQVFLLPLGSDTLKISGSTALKMSSFQIEPPTRKLSSLVIKTGDEVVITFSWILGPRKASERQSSAALTTSQQPFHQESTTSTTPAGQEELIPAASIRFIKTPLAQVLDVYAVLTPGQLDIDDAVKRLPAMIRFTNTETVTRAQAIVLLDSALFEQSGIVVTHPEPNRVKLQVRR